MPGPLPDPNKRRRNAPTIPTTNLPISGRKDPAPSVPGWVSLGELGQAWWDWAWTTPQACGWGVGSGMESVIARRAALQDDLHAAETSREQVAIAGKMLDIDDRLGLTPKGLAALRWVIVADKADAPTAPKADGTVTVMDDRRKRLSGAS